MTGEYTQATAYYATVGRGREGIEGKGKRERERGEGGRERGEHPIVAQVVLTLTSGSSDSMGTFPLVCQQETCNLACSTPAVQDEVKNTQPQLI